jgi:uncharacterized protein YjeT (DUF2065 family)
MQETTHFLGVVLALLGGLGLLAGIVLLRFPSAVRTGLAAFPRSKWPGWILTALCLFWVSWVIRHAALGRFEALKPLIPVIALLVFMAIIWFLDELLAPRALGGLLLLVANPILNGVRWVDSVWRLVPVLIAYAWVIAGCALMLHPWLFRKMAERILRSDDAVRLAGWGKLLAGAILLAAGLWQLR